jgi:hypothetical protein
MIVKKLCYKLSQTNQVVKLKGHKHPNNVMGQVLMI